jgi:hypothetical protein
MAIKKSFNGASIRKPGAYSKFKVDNSSGGDLAANDTLFLVGESSKGAPGSVEGIQNFSSSNLDALVAKYGSGPIVDCAIAAVRPSKTPGIGGAGRILVYKTNASTQASASLSQSSNPYATVNDLGYGLGGNLYSVVVSAGDSASQKNVAVTQLGGVTESLGENKALNVIQVQYTGNGSAATLSIAGLTRAALVLTTSLTGASDGSANLSVALANKTMKQLVDYINAQPGYVASIQTASLSALSATDLDPVSAIDVKTAAKMLKRLQKEIIELINTSARVMAVEPSQPLGGVPDAQTKALSGGVQGSSSNTNFSTAFSNSLSQDYNVLLPCVSRDASEDIADAQLGFTDPSSSYTISAVMAAAVSHLALRGDTKNRKEAQGMGGIRKSTKAAAYSAINAVASENMQVAMQDVVFSDASGNLKVGQPHVFAAMCAGIRLGTEVGEPLTHKFLNALQVGHFLNPSTLVPAGDFDPNLDGDDAIDNGVLFSEKFGNGNRIVVDNTTYGQDGSFIFNRGSVIEASYFVFRTLRETAESIFVGHKVSNGLASSIKNAIRNKLRELNAPDVNIITSSDDAKEGFREDTFVVTVSGNTARVVVEFKPVQGLDFIFFDFTLGDIKQSA